MSAWRREKGPAEILVELELELEHTAPRRAYVLRGEERYFRERALGCLCSKARALGWEVALHDAESGNPDFVLNRLVDDLGGGGGLFAPHRLIVVRNPEGLLASASGGESPFLVSARAFLGAGEAGGCLVVSAASLRADAALAKAVSSGGGSVLSFRRLWEGPPPWNPDPRRAELVQWLLSRARDQGLALSSEGAVYLCAAIGNDLFALEGELERLRSLPAADLRAIVEWRAASPPWAVAEDIVQGDLARSLAAVEALFRGGFQEKGKRLVDAAALSAMTIASLGREVRRSLALAWALERGLDPEEAGERSGTKGRGWESFVARTTRFPARVWRARLEDVADLERRAKSGVGVDANDFVALLLRWDSTARHARAPVVKGSPS